MRRVVLLFVLALVLILVVNYRQPPFPAFAGNEDDLQSRVISREIINHCRIEGWVTACVNGVQLVGTTCTPDPPDAPGHPCSAIGCVQISYITDCEVDKSGCEQIGGWHSCDSPSFIGGCSEAGSERNPYFCASRQVQLEECNSLGMGCAEACYWNLCWNSSCEGCLQ